MKNTPPPLHSVTRTSYVLVIDVGTSEIRHACANRIGKSFIDANELIGTDWRTRIHPDDLMSAEHSFQLLMERGELLWTGRIQLLETSYQRVACAVMLTSDMQYLIAMFNDLADLQSDEFSVRQFERLREVSADGFIVADQNGNLISTNQAARRPYGLSAESSLERNVSEILGEEAASIFQQVAVGFEPGSEFVEYEHAVESTKYGKVHLEGRACFDIDTQRWYIVERDVTTRVEHQHELEVAQTFYDIASSQLALLNSAGTILKTNPGFKALFSSRNLDFEGRNIDEVLGLAAKYSLSRVISEVVTGADTTETFQITVLLEGNLRVLQGTLSSQANSDLVYFNARDITEEHRLAAELLDRATHDRLTGLVNRDAFSAKLEDALSHGELTALIMLDLDEFKRVNDTLGHAAGDQMLLVVADRISSAIRPSDLVGRFGGDEFVVLLRGQNCAQSAGEVSRRISVALAKPTMISGRMLHTTASLGVSIGDRSTHDASRLFREADAAAYAAKRAGRNTVHWFGDHLRLALERDDQVEHELRYAFDNKGIDLDAQGIFSIDGELTAVELLARLVTPDGRRLAPGHFLDVARRLDLLARLTDEAFLHAMSGMKDWLENSPQAVIHLNIDPIEVGAPGFIPALKAVLAKTEVNPTQVMIEVTESGFVDPTGSSAKTLEAIRALGCGIAIDDFGSGATSFSYLRDLKVDQVKLDREFTNAINDNPNASVITKAIIDICNQLGISVLAEGVETAEQLETLRALGCPLVQGYFLHRPEPMTQFVTQTS